MNLHNFLKPERVVINMSRNFKSNCQYFSVIVQRRHQVRVLLSTCAQVLAKLPARVNSEYLVLIFSSLDERCSEMYNK